MFMRKKNSAMKMTNASVPLIIPIENQVRELDPKLLLACIAARRGFSSIIGLHREIDFRIASFPRSIYLCKSMTERNLKMFQIMRNVGHQIVTWDEEALVHLPSETYYSRRLDPVTIRYVSHLFAWGEDNAELWRRYPSLPDGMPIHVTGNPRSDMLRSELQPFYNDEMDQLKKLHGDFILINTNFNHVNAFFPAQNLFRPLEKTDAEPEFGKAAVGMSREYAFGLRDHKLAIFDAFKDLIPRLSRAFPDHTLVVRPHPTENQEIYKQIAEGCKRVVVTNAGNVVPWLMATKAVIHNGCTTGVEAFVMGVPAISYRPRINETYDNGFYRLPNLVSYQCFNFEELQDTLESILNGRLGAVNGDERKAGIDESLAAQDGALACERIVDVLVQISETWTESPEPAWHTRILGRGMANGRRLVVFLRKYFSQTAAPPEFHRHRYPGISLEELRSRISKFQQVLNDSTDIKAEQIRDQIFRIST
jgi:surface carbohydrate biosynthesis protein